jgi:hypothetical protein
MLIFYRMFKGRIHIESKRIKVKRNRRYRFFEWYQSRNLSMRGHEHDSLMTILTEQPAASPIAQ